jgi:beta-lactamase class A
MVRSFLLLTFLAVSAASGENDTIHGPSADKTGRCANGATNDVAIMRSPDRAPIFLAIYSVGSTATANDREAAIAEAAKIVAESL